MTRRDQDDRMSNGARKGGAATILDIAARTGLSKSVVSRAMRGQYGVSPDARDRVAAAAEELGYVLNAAAQSLSAHRTNTIGVLVRDASSAFYGEMQSALQKRGTQIQHRVIITSGALDNDDERRALEDLIALRVDGLIVCSGRLPASAITRFSASFPLVVAGRRELEPRLNSVFGDEDAGARALAHHLADSGHTRVAVVGPTGSESPVLARRLRIMAAALTSRGAEVARVRAATPADLARPELVPAQVTAAMCANDRFAEALLLARRVTGKPLAVTGFDGVGGLASQLIGLTTWRQPIDAIGTTAVDLLMRVIAEPTRAVEHVRLPGELRVSNTTQDH